jgi:hypothetical protein
LKNFINFIIVKEKQLIIEYYSGKIYLEDFIKIHDKKSNDVDFNVNFNLLIDFRDAEIYLDEKDVLELVKYHKNSKKLFGKRYAAHLTQTPNQVVAGINFDQYNTELPIQIKIFSTLEASLSWIGLKIDDKNMIQSYLDTLKAQRTHSQQ